MLFVGAVLLAWIGVRNGAGRGHWFGLAAVVLYLAVDEAFALHERTIQPIHQAWSTGGPFYYAWVLPAIAAVAVSAVVFGRFVWRLDPPVRRLLVAAAGLFVTAALGFEMVEGLMADSLGVGGAPMTVVVVLEETLELIAVVLLLQGLLLKLRFRETSEITDEAGRGGAPAPAPVVARPIV